MIRRPPRSTRTDTLVPSTTLFRSFRYALLLMAGRHVERDKEKADEYMRKAAEAGNSSAQFNWAQILVSDHPGEKGLKLALPFYEKAARQGLADAQYAVAQIYEIGRASCREECVSTCRSRWSPYH